MADQSISNGRAAWETTLQTALDAAVDMVFITDETPADAGGPCILYANQAMLAEFGYVLSDLMGRAPAFAVGPRTDTSVLDGIRQAMSSSRDASGEILVYRADGTTFWSDWRVHKVPGPDGGSAQWVSIGRNTDERRRSEDRLSMLSTAIDHANDAVFVYSIRTGDAVPYVRYVNAAGIAHTGFTQAELQTTTRLGSLSGEGVVEEVVREMRAGRPMLKRMRLYRKDGTVYWANVSLQPIRDRRGEWSQWVCIERDITDIVEREEMRSDLMAMIGHDLRNPLTNILGFSEILLEDLAGSASFEAAMQIRISARRLESLAAEMLTLSLLERDQYRPQLMEMELGAIVLDVLTYFADRERIDIEITEAAPILADPAGLRHVIENLLSNAAKFSSDRVTATILVIEGAAVLRVDDRGIGIPAADLPHIFERATRAANVGSRKGTGLGLSFVRQLVELAGGMIQINSMEGMGTTVEVFFSPLPLSS